MIHTFALRRDCTCSVKHSLGHILNLQPSYSSEPHAEISYDCNAIDFDWTHMMRSWDRSLMPCYLNVLSQKKSVDLTSVDHFSIISVMHMTRFCPFCRPFFCVSSDMTSQPLRLRSGTAWRSSVETGLQWGWFPHSHKCLLGWQRILQCPHRQRFSHCHIIESHPFTAISHLLLHFLIILMLLVEGQAELVEY